MIGMYDASVLISTCYLLLPYLSISDQSGSHMHLRCQRRGNHNHENLNDNNNNGGIEKDDIVLHVGPACRS